jgi:hypothetical protein
MRTGGRKFTGQNREFVCLRRGICSWETGKLPGTAVSFKFLDPEKHWVKRISGILSCPVEKEQTRKTVTLRVKVIAGAWGGFAMPFARPLERVVGRVSSVGNRR